jgi:hypothetical protein
METLDDRQPQHSVLIQALLSPRLARPARGSASFMKTPPNRLFALKVISFLILGGWGLFAPIATALAQQLSREQDIGGLRLGQRIKVDDGTCPAGQVKEISGTRMTSTGIIRTQKCIPRLGPKQK